MQVLGRQATPTLQDLGNRQDPRGAQGIAARGPSNFMGVPGRPGAGRPSGPRLQFDVETLQRRLMDNAAANRQPAFG